MASLPAKLKESGQTMVEYLLMLGMVVVIGMTIFKSKVFQDFMGPDSKFFAALRLYTEYGYRHGEVQSRKEESSDGVSTHNSYYKSGKTRFFISRGDPYP